MMKNDIVITEYNIHAPIERPLCFAFVSDLHDTPNEPILEALSSRPVDAVLVGGDFIHNAAIYARGIEFLRCSAGRFPTFCALGNHEKRFAGDLRRLLDETGAVTLDNEAVSFGGITIGGLTTGYEPENAGGWARTTPPPDLGWLKTFSEIPGFKLLLSHHPEYYAPYIRPLPIDLTLSGHAHGGQWRLFGRGLYAPGQGLFPRYTSGLYEGRLLVGRGLGNAHKIPRINNKPEIVMIHLNH